MPNICKKPRRPLNAGGTHFCKANNLTLGLPSPCQRYPARQLPTLPNRRHHRLLHVRRPRYLGYGSWTADPLTTYRIRLNSHTTSLSRYRPVMTTSWRLPMVTVLSTSTSASSFPKYVFRPLAWHLTTVPLYCQWVNLCSTTVFDNFGTKSLATSSKILRDSGTRSLCVGISQSSTSTTSRRYQHRLCLLHSTHHLHHRALRSTTHGGGAHAGA